MDAYDGGKRERMRKKREIATEKKGKSKELVLPFYLKVDDFAPDDYIG